MFYERGANPDWDSDKAKLHFTQVSDAATQRYRATRFIHHTFVSFVLVSHPRTTEQVVDSWYNSPAMYVDRTRRSKPQLGRQQWEKSP